MKHQPNRYWSTTKISNIGTKTATRIPSIIIWRVHWSRIWRESLGCIQLYGSRFLKALSWSMILNVYLQQKLETRHLLLFSFRGNPATCGSLRHQPRCSCIKVKSNPCRWLPIHQVICPRHDNFREMSDRKYRSSLDAAFSANVAFVLYECESAPIKRVATFHQESITICSEWTRVRRKYSSKFYYYQKWFNRKNWSKSRNAQRSSATGRSSRRNTPVPSPVRSKRCVVVTALMSNLRPAKLTTASTGRLYRAATSISSPSSLHS